VSAQKPLALKALMKSTAIFHDQFRDAE